MILTTTDRLDGFRVAKVCGLVFGNSARTRGLLGQLLFMAEQIIGGTGNAYLVEFNKAKNLSVEDAVNQAQKMGANAIIGIDFDITEIREGYLLASVNGTAVILEQVK